MNPTFYISLLAVYTQKIKYASAREEVFANFRLSHRGSIRKPPNAITWVYCLEQLQEDHGERDASAVLKIWNVTSPKQSQIVGGKAQAVKNVMMLMSKEAKKLITSHVAQHGWEACAWNEDTLSSKKLFPPYAPRGANKVWNDRQKITTAAVDLMVKHVHSHHDKLHNNMKRAMMKSDCEEVALQAAVCHALVKEVQARLPITDAVMKVKWLDKFEQADAKVTSELAMAIADKNERFTLRDIPTLAEIMDTHSGDTPVAEPCKMSVDKAELERSTFELNMKQLEYDLQAWRVLDSKLSNYVGAMNTMKTDWRLNAWKDNMDVAKNYLKNNVLVASWEQEDLHPRFTSFKSTLEKKLQMSSESMV